MPSIGSSVPAKISRWKLMDKRLQERLEEIPHLAEAHARLARLIAEAEASQARFEVHRVAWRKAAQETDAIAREADELRSRLSSALHFHFGSRNLQLAEFGLKPHARNGRPRKSARTAPSPEHEPGPLDEQVPGPPMSADPQE